MRTSYVFLTKKEKDKPTFTRSASDNGREETSRFSSWVTNSITGNGSMKAVEDISITWVDTTSLD